MDILILFTMLFLHIVDDYYLQGILAKMKQRSWWEENAPDPLYENDYKVALLTHAFSWTFMIMLPITMRMVINNNVRVISWCIAFGINWLTHTWIDHLKANVHNCNLLEDQIIHITQIIATWSTMMYLIEI